MKVVISVSFGGFGISTEAYEKLIEWGIPVRKYVDQERDPNTGLFLPQPLNDEEVIFDRELTLSGQDDLDDVYHQHKQSRAVERYWDAWISGNRTHPLLIKLVEELGSEKASGPFAELKIVEVPDGVEWEIHEYDGLESIHEKHRVWS